MILRRMILALAVTLFSSLAVADAPASEPCPHDPAKVFAQASPAVVFIAAIAINPYALDARVDTAIGSGFVFNAEGLILTNAHVVFGRQAIAVTFSDGESLPAEVVGADPILDLAVLRLLETREAMSVLEIPAEYTYTVGQEVLAIGNPLGFRQSLTRGIISGLDRILPVSPMSLTIPMIQTDAAINPGNSGGPLLDSCGRAIGIATSKLAGVDNIGFALPATIIREVLPKLLTFGRIPRPWLGLRGQFVEKKNLAQFFSIELVDGFLVEAVEPDSPAMRAGVQGGLLPMSIGDQSFLFGGDVITAINGTPLSDEASFLKVIQAVRIGDSLTMEYMRAGNREKTRMNVIERPILPLDLVTQ